MSDPSITFQMAIYSALNAGLSVPVYDSVPQGTAYPYVTIDYQESEMGDFLSSRTDKKMLYLSVWSDYRGQKEVLQIMGEIDALLHEKNLSLTEGRVVIMQVQSKRTSRDSDGLTYMGLVKLKTLLQF